MPTSDVSQPPMKFSGLRKSEAGGLVRDTLGITRHDKAKMSATAVINTPDCDREGEVILAEGIDFGNYRKNPIVLWEHGVAGLTLPIASSENPDDGSLAISVNGGVIEGTSYFTNKLRESEQIYDLICDGIIRATSIHVIPRKAPIQRTLNSGRLVSVYDESEMLEWSWCMYGVNPQAVRKALSAKTIAGSRLADSIRKSLLPFADKPKGVVRGASLPGVRKSMTPEEIAAKTDEELKSMVADQNTDAAVKAMCNDELTKRASGYNSEEIVVDPAGSVAKSETEVDAPAEVAEKAATGGTDAGEDAPEGSETETSETTVTSDSPLGSQILASLHQSVSDLIGMVEQASKPLENPDVKDGLAAELQTLRDSLTAIEGLFSTAYPDMPGLKSSDVEGETTKTEDAVKSWLHRNRRSQHGFAGIGAKLGAIASAANLTSSQKSALSHAKSFLDRAIGQARDEAKRAATVAAKATDPSKSLAKSGAAVDAAAHAQAANQDDAANKRLDVLEKKITAVIAKFEAMSRKG